MRRLEKDTVEADVVRAFDKVAHALKLIPVKITPLGVRGFPDKMYLGKNRVIFFVEFKRPGKKPRHLQKIWHRLLKKMGFNVYVVDKICKETARRICLENIQPA